jgi:hypothetical protein
MTKRWQIQSERCLCLAPLASLLCLSGTQQGKFSIENVDGCSQVEAVVREVPKMCSFAAADVRVARALAITRYSHK